MDLHAGTELFQAAAAAATAGRLSYLGLARRYPGLLSYLVFIAASDLAYGVLKQHSQVYFWLFVATTPLEIIFDIFVVRELFTVTFRDYKGILTVGRWALYAGIGVAAIVSLAITKYLWDTGSATGKSRVVLFFFEVAQRSMALTLAVVIVTIIFVLSKYPLHLDKNFYISCACFSAVFLTDAARLCVDGLAPALFNDYADWSAVILTALVLVGWAALLGPYKAPAATTALPTAEEKQLLLQLKVLNDMMARAGRQ